MPVWRRAHGLDTLKTEQALVEFHLEIDDSDHDIDNDGQNSLKWKALHSN